MGASIETVKLQISKLQKMIDERNDKINDLVEEIESIQGYVDDLMEIYQTESEE